MARRVTDRRAGGAAEHPVCACRTRKGVATRRHRGVGRSAPCSRHRRRRAFRSGDARAHDPVEQSARLGSGPLPASNRAHRRHGSALGDTVDRSRRCSCATGHSDRGRAGGFASRSGRHDPHLRIHRRPEGRRAYSRHPGPADVDVAGRHPIGHRFGVVGQNSLCHAVLLGRWAARDDGCAARTRHPVGPAQARRLRRAGSDRARAGDGNRGMAGLHPAATRASIVCEP